MAYQEVKRTSYGKNIGNSFKGIFTGIFLVILCTIAIFWNENKAIKKYKAINRAQDVCVEMEDINTVNAEFDGKVVHAHGIATTSETLNDNLFGVSLNALSINRKVEYYQLVEKSKTEKKEKIGGATEEITTYYYERQWVSTPQSNSFKDTSVKEKNFVFAQVDEQTVEANDVRFGAYQLPEFIYSSIGGSEPATPNLDSTMLAEWNSLVKHNLGLSNSLDVNYINVNGNVVYIGTSSTNPSIGDVRITLTYVPNDQEISIIAKVKGNTFDKYADKNGKTVSSVAAGDKTADEMFESLKQSNKIWTWVTRIILLILIISGFKKMVSIVPTLLKVLPFLGKGVEAILGFACTILGVVWTFLFIAIAWVAVRPVIAIILLVAIAALIVWLVMRSKKAKATQQAENVAAN